MENGWIIGVLMIVGAYYLFKYFSKEKYTQEESITDVISNKDYQIKGQWDK